MTGSGDLAARLDWAKGGGLLPAIVQHAHTGEALMLGYMNAAALQATLERQCVVFFSRTRQRLWMKGETSGNRLELVSITPDCDRDTLLVRANPLGPVCHLGTASCFADAPQRPAGASDVLAALDAVIAQRAATRPAGSYVARLLSDGPLRAAQKVGEEAVELALAAAMQPDDAVTSEAADLLFHMLVLLRARGIELRQVLEVLAERRGPER